MENKKAGKEKEAENGKEKNGVSKWPRGHEFPKNSRNNSLVFCLEHV